MENHWNQFSLVLWKHVYMNRIRRHWAGTLLQVLAMVVLQYGVWEESVAPYAASPNKERSFDMTKPMDLWGQRNRSAPRGRLAFAPPSNPFGEVVRRACDRLDSALPVESAKPGNIRWFADPVPLANATALDAYLRRWENGTRLLLGVQFEARDNDTNGSSSSSLSYAVRAPFGTFDLQLQYKRHLLIPGPKDIGRFGEMTILLPLQYAVESAFIDIIAESRQKNATRHVELQRLPYPRLFYGPRKSEERTLSLTALRFAIGFFVPFGVVVVTLVREKRSGMKGMLRRAGLSDGFYWLGHLAEGVFVVALSLAVMYVMLFGIYNQRGTTFLFYADSTLVMAVFMVFGLLTILHAMLLSVFLWNVCVSFAAAVVYWTLLSLAPYLWLQQVFGVGYYLVPRGRKIATSLSPVMFLHWCFRVIERFEKYGISISWKHFFDKSTTMDNVSVGELVLISLNASMALFVFVWYLDNIAPWNYGVPKSFYFLLSMDYWFPYRKWNIRNDMQNTDPNIYEQDPKSSEPIINIINVSKETTNSSYPLDRVNLTVFNNQITVFLGPENSGHKTLLKIMTGTDVPSSGNVYICNFDVVNNPSKCWEFFSYCPSEIILFSDLTVKEHLLFFASLRQLDGEEAEEAVETVMRQLHLVNYKDELVSELCQKTQRMLCLAIATCTVNQTPVLIIDEPTRLMDPKSRHEIWCLLSRASRKCSVVVLTKSIEEAETLGDRVVIMRDGRVCCCGSPLWLKDRFGIGDCLRFTKFPHFRGDAVRKLIHAYMGAIRRRQDSRIEVIYWLGTLRNITKMAALVHTLDRRRTALGIAVMSVTSTTLEDVYLKMVGIPDFKGTGQEFKTLPSLAEYEASMEQQELEALRQLCTTRTSSPSALSVLGTLLDKRFHIWTRIWWFKSLSLLLPLLTLILLGLTIRLVRFESRPYQRSITYNAAAVFDRSYGFVEGDGSQNHFLSDFMRPVLVENGVNLLVVNGTSMERELLLMADEDINVYIYEYQFGVSLHKNDRVFLWYNGQCPHSGPLVVNMYHTALLRSVSGESRSTITLVNSPVLDDDSVQRAIFESQHGKLASDQTDDTFSRQNTLSRALNSFFVSLAMGFYSACHLVEPIGERLSGFKHLQLMTGMSGSLYWIGHLLFDGAGAMVSSCVFMAAFIFSHDTLPGTYWGE
ncbi:hypothetical protein HPB47_008824 [Ixodes persulcatus]|uniref:Uncharacterized protein n=1 Tax=Ixodes persulcatus TaxID=34615 RepID=A0AC60P3R7_IXOPE|nr:hypothetical protein HPB47_008824 [Ixodes persulcatus]